MLSGGFGLLFSSWLIGSTTATTTTPPCAEITEFVLGYLMFLPEGTVSIADDSYAVIGVMMADIEFRKHHDPVIQSMSQLLGSPHFPIQDLNPCFRIRPIVMKRGPAPNQSYEINAAWAASSLIGGTDGYPKVDGLCAQIRGSMHKV